MGHPLENLTGEQADLCILVLESQGIKTDVKKKGELFNLVVVDDLKAHAIEALCRFYDENLDTAAKKSGVLKPLPVKRGAMVLSVLLIACLHGGFNYFGIHYQMIKSYGSSALYVLQGEHYRVVTALMLHADLKHLLGNVAGILIFGIPVCSIAGTGRGMCLMVLAGGAGNLINAHFYRTAHLSVGASTAVMGAAGILVAFQVIKRLSVSGFKPGILVPLGAGAALVGMLSGGENTDITAHLFGFLAGLLVGGVFSFLPRPDMVQTSKDRYFLLSIIVIIALSWFKLP